MDPVHVAARLIERLREPARYPHPVDRVELIETHISWVLLAGEFAYKVKKPVDLGFLDFTALAARKRFCEEELRLNRRTAPELYLEAVPIGGTPDDPRLGATPAIEYAVKMRRFAQDALLDRMAKRGALTAAHVDAIAAAVADFHARIERVPRASGCGSPERVAAFAEQNFEQLDALVAAPADFEHLDRLRTWTGLEFSARREIIAERKRDGFVRECHGDLHLGNIALIDGRPVAFDCIEFNDDLRWIDVMSEVAFLVMDLLDHRLDALAWRCLDRYLQLTGDYTGIAVLRFHLVYRAMVRAKVACMRARQPGLDAAAHARLADEYRSYFGLASRLAESVRPAIVLMHGLSGSGKTTVAQLLLESLGAIRVRSDVERKRLHGLDPLARTSQALGAGLYGPEATQRTYDRLAAAARAIVDAGFPAIVDAASLRRPERDAMRELARALGVRFFIATCTAPEAVLRQRISAREQAGADASEATAAVLDLQLAAQEPLGADEQSDAVVFDTVAGADAIATAVRALEERIA
ncbi:MAG TPA: AAA family ATPase [Burkholderiales bacterium]|nr:AAA family ATPase [Burkholderiales bacterium]